MIHFSITVIFMKSEFLLLFFILPFRRILVFSEAISVHYRSTGHKPVVQIVIWIACIFFPTYIQERMKSFHFETKQYEISMSLCNKMKRSVVLLIYTAG